MRLFKITTDTATHHVYAGNEALARELWQAAYPETPIQSLVDVFESGQPGIIGSPQGESVPRRKPAK